MPPEALQALSQAADALLQLEVHRRSTRHYIQPRHVVAAYR
jgi:hypothetical protein